MSCHLSAVHKGERFQEIDLKGIPFSLPEPRAPIASNGERFASCRVFCKSGASAGHRDDAFSIRIRQAQGELFREPRSTSEVAAEGASAPRASWEPASLPSRMK